MPSSPSTLRDELKRAGGPYTKFGAGLLADAITQWWHSRGHGNVKAERYSMPALGLWGVRSNLVAGLPPKSWEVRRVVDLGGGKCRVEKSIEQRRREFLDA